MKTYRVVVSAQAAGTADIYVQADSVAIVPHAPLPVGLLVFHRATEGRRGRGQKVAEFSQWLGYVDESKIET